MRDFASCFNEYAVHVSDSYACASHAGNSCISSALTPSAQNTVVCVYRAVLSSRRIVPIRVSWTRTAASQGLTVNFGDDAASAAVFKLNGNARLFRKKKGSKSLEFGNSKVEVFWDLSAARYCAGPEPIDGFYVLAAIDSELSLLLGDMAEEASCRKIKPGFHPAKCSLISRQEHFAGNALYSTKAQFSDTGTPHDVVVSCYGDNAAAAANNNSNNKHPVLSVSIDKKMVIRVKRLQWNFRGNHTIFVDGLLVDLMWDVHDWFYNNSGPGIAVFMFRTRSGMDSRLWLEEKLQSKKDEDKVDFSFLIYATRST
nr:unnamed protein product [Ipomoea trifida]GMD27291.1 unnamed protein product [Ipomoea batatas]GMD39474.1 unnamed protein product [Ipomoea batatas]GME11659.1 unnamed protein product [Ipomoea batatas]